MITPATAQPDTLKLYAFLPPFLQDNDEAGGYQFLSWLDGFISEGSAQSALTYTYGYNDGNVTLLPEPITVSTTPAITGVGIQTIDNVVRDTPYAPGWSPVMDINRCPEWALPWLAQFVGVRISPFLSDAAKRAAITLECPWARGTVAYIAYHANLWMIPPYTVTIQERTSFIGSTFGYDPYAVTITFPEAGVGWLTYGQLNAEFADYADVESNYSTYADMHGNTDNLEAAVLAVMPAGLKTYFNPI